MDDATGVSALKGRWADYTKGIARATRSGSEGFPYPTHEAVAKAMREGEAHFPMNVGVMYEVAKTVSITPWKLFVLACIVPPIAVVAAAFYWSDWWYLASLLAVPMALGLFHPTVGKVYKTLCIVTAAGAYIGLGLGIICEVHWLTLTCGVGAFYHTAWRLSTAASRRLANDAICGSEELLCQLWNAEKVFLRLADGRTFFPDPDA